MKMLFVATLMVLGSFAHAADGDLTMPGERWLAGFDKYICTAFQPEIARPTGFEDFKVQFETFTTDKTLDNVLLKATYEENGKACRYSAIILADNAAKTWTLVQSKGFAPADNTECAAGKAVLDAAFTGGEYLYYGHPHNLAFMVPVAGAKEVCGTDVLGVNFVLKGKLPEQN